MASNYSANQFESSYAPNFLQNWCVAKDNKKQPETHDGYTQIIVNDRGHLLPSVPRSKTSPWGTFMGTWQMPLQIPPARINLTSRSTASANRLMNWVQKNPDLLNASNGLRPEIRGRPQDPGPREKERSPQSPEKKTATPKAVQEIPNSSSAINSPPSKGLPNASPAPLPPPSRIRSSSSSCSCSCSCSRSSKMALNSPTTPEACQNDKEPEGPEIQERNIEKSNEEPQQELEEIAPLSPKEITE